MSAVDTSISHAHTAVSTHFRSLSLSLSLWFVLISTAISAGIISACLDIIIDWLSDLRQGHCTSLFLRSLKSCCPMHHMCDDWIEHTTATNNIIAFLVYVFSAILLALASATLVAKLAPRAFHTGIPEIKAILGGIAIRDFLSMRTLVVKAVALSLSVASGLSLGKEGPLIHVTCALAELYMGVVRRIGVGVGDWTNSGARQRQTYAAAAAAGVSVAFGAPLGGVMFALEELDINLFPTNTLWQAFVCAALAAVTLQWCNPFGTGKLVLFSVSTNQSWKQFELVFWLLLGALGGLAGVALLRLNLFFARLRRDTTLRRYPILETTAVALLTALLSYASILTRVQNTSLVAALLQECSNTNTTSAPTLQLHATVLLCNSDRRVSVTVMLLAYAAVVKLLLTAYTFGLSVPAGIFLPGLSIGACMGRALGGLLELVEERYSTLAIFADCHGASDGGGCIRPGLYATVGAAATLAGITRMTVSLVVIVFELTGALSHVVPIMIAVMTAKWVADAFGKQGVFTAWISHQQYTYIPQVDIDVGLGVRGASVRDMHGVCARDVALSHYPTLPADGEIRELMELTRGNDDDDAHTHTHGYAIITRNDSLLVGWVQAEKIVAIGGVVESNSTIHSSFSFNQTETPDTLDLSTYVDTAPLFFYASTPINVIVATFQSMGVDRVFVVSQPGTLVGVIERVQISQLMAGRAGGLGLGWPACLTRSKGRKEYEQVEMVEQAGEYQLEEGG
ncbi:hypothetical protein E3P89_03859 [Wallemia ichthyophaga]|nr:hypothetical protein E3P93_03869 [Wallemia ichthyophaga]TIB19545.1 hypothetical protein E3P89_03859 [Wallemia ichthyophaga]